MGTDVDTVAKTTVLAVNVAVDSTDAVTVIEAPGTVQPGIKDHFETVFKRIKIVKGTKEAPKIANQASERIEPVLINAKDLETVTVPDKVLLAVNSINVIKDYAL